jgi:hypothetical protein
MGGGANEDFVPSEELKAALKGWANEKHKMNLIEGWNKLFTDVYVELFSGKISISDAEARVSPISSFVLYESEGSTEVQRIYESLASKWKAGQWKSRLAHLREIKKYTTS